MQPHLPEELEAMAWLYGQSRQIDSMMVEQNKELVTNSNTIRDQINVLSNIQKQQAMQNYQVAHVVDTTPIPLPIDNIQTGHYQYHPHNQNDLLPLPKTQAPMLQYQQPDPAQLEFNLEPDKADIIINLLKEINIKLGKLIKKEENVKNTTEKKSVPKIPQRNLDNQ
jgi:hypothetical protein